MTVYSNFALNTELARCNVCTKIPDNERLYRYIENPKPNPLLNTDSISNYEVVYSERRLRLRITPVGRVKYGKRFSSTRLPRGRRLSSSSSSS